MRSPKRRKRGSFRASKEAKRLARLRVGSVPASRRQESDRHSPPKHKKREFEQDAGLL